jgi:hypothetical protein
MFAITHDMFVCPENINNSFHLPAHLLRRFVWHVVFFTNTYKIDRPHLLRWCRVRCQDSRLQEEGDLTPGHSVVAPQYTSMENLKILYADDRLP